jgi:hypothetical protein
MPVLEDSSDKKLGPYPELKRADALELVDFRMLLLLKDFLLLVDVLSRDSLGAIGNVCAWEFSCVCRRGFLGVITWSVLVRFRGTNRSASSSPLSPPNVVVSPLLVLISSSLWTRGSNAETLLVQRASPMFSFAASTLRFLRDPLPSDCNSNNVVSFSLSFRICIPAFFHIFWPWRRGAWAGTEDRSQGLGLRVSWGRANASRNTPLVKPFSNCTLLWETHKKKK